MKKSIALCSLFGLLSLSPVQSHAVVGLTTAGVFTTLGGIVGTIASCTWAASRGGRSGLVCALPIMGEAFSIAYLINGRSEKMDGPAALRLASGFAGVTGIVLLSEAFPVNSFVQFQAIDIDSETFAQLPNETKQVIQVYNENTWAYTAALSDMRTNQSNLVLDNDEANKAFEMRVGTEASSALSQLLQTTVLK